jgi:tryptophan synthase beta subunit
VYVIREDLAKQEGLKLNASIGIVVVALIYGHHRIVLEVRIA